MQRILAPTDPVAPSASLLLDLFREVQRAEQLAAQLQTRVAAEQELQLQLQQERRAREAETRHQERQLQAAGTVCMTWSPLTKRLTCVSSPLFPSFSRYTSPFSDRQKMADFAR